MKTSARVLYGLALSCWAVPFLAGIATFAVWRMTWSPVLIDAGISIILGGTILCAGGLVLLWFFQRAVAKDPRISDRHRSRRIKLGCALLLSNFPLAGTLAATAISLLATPHVEVCNASPLPLTDLTLIHHSQSISLDNLSPGEADRARIRHPSDGSVSLRGRVGHTSFDVVVIDYVTNNDGRRWRVTVSSADAMVTESLNP